MNLAAFEWGRATYADPNAISALVDPRAQPAAAETLDQIVARRADFLTAYQNLGYARRYQELVARITEAERKRAPVMTGLAETVARNLFKLMAYKDEYEVARLYSDGSFQRQAAAAFDGDLRFEFRLAPPLFARKDKVTGEARKMRFGHWMVHLFRYLAALRFLRGTALDPFGYLHERREERRLIGEYEVLCDKIEKTLNADNHAVAVALAALPEKIRGYGHVKARGIAGADAEREKLMAQWPSPGAIRQKAAE
jgi:indolepyruvate ferredoxin oxidoreductase